MAIDVRYPVESDPTHLAAAEAPAAEVPDVAAEVPDVAAEAPAPEVPYMAEAPAPPSPTSGAEPPTAASGPEPGAPTPAPHLRERSRRGWGRGFDPDRLAVLELRMWKAYYRREPVRLFGLLVRGLREQANVSLPRAVLAATFLTKAAAGFARATGDYHRFAPDIARGYRLLGMPRDIDVDAVARHELAWWVVRRDMGLAAGVAAGESITRLYAAMYGVPEADVADAGRLRGLAAEVRDRGATVDPDGPRGPGDAYWPMVARLLRESYRSLSVAIDR
jgi:hypothetical protein